MKLKIIKNALIKERRYLLELAAPPSFKKSLPGQFVHIRLEDSCDPLLRRPLSIHALEEKKNGRGIALKIFYEVVGKGTELLRHAARGQEIDCIGPLGHGFDLKHLMQAENIFIVAGGMGVAPLFFLAEKIKEIQNPKSLPHRPAGKIQINVLIGAKAQEHIMCEKEFKKLGCEVRIATDDGSKGFKGRVPDLLKKILTSTMDHGLSTICACGPKPMLAAVTDVAKQMNVHAQVSLEEFMGCGLGACLGCVIRTTSGYQRICHDGPVFDSREIIWRE